MRSLVRCSLLLGSALCPVRGPTPGRRRKPKRRRKNMLLRGWGRPPGAWGLSPLATRLRPRRRDAPLGGRRRPVSGSCPRAGTSASWRSAARGGSHRLRRRQGRRQDRRLTTYVRDVAVWDLIAWKEVADSAWRSTRAARAKVAGRPPLSPDGKTLAERDLDGDARVWDTIHRQAGGAHRRQQRDRAGLHAGQQGRRHRRPRAPVPVSATWRPASTCAASACAGRACGRWRLPDGRWMATSARTAAVAETRSSLGDRKKARPRASCPTKNSRRGGSGVTT